MMADLQPPQLKVPEGLKPGDTPDGLMWPRSLWLVLPADPSSSQQESYRKLRHGIAEQSDIRVADVKVQNISGYGGLKYPLIPTKDVAGLYRQAHRARTAVIALCGAKVHLEIDRTPTNSGCVSLERFIQHKCWYSLVSRPEEAGETLTAALRWMSEIYCDGPRDPRCFPAAVFETDRPYPLDTPTERREFVSSHRASKNSRHLIDARRRAWLIGPPHTLDLIQVGGRTLPIGFHWDVQSPRDSIITTGWEIWRIPGRGYTNVHPDALIRGGNSIKTHPTERNKSKAPKAPRRKARRRKR